MSNQHEWHTAEELMMDDEESSTDERASSKPKWIKVLGLTLVAGGVAFGAWKLSGGVGSGMPASTAAASNASASAQTVVAKVNGLAVTESEIQGFLQTGVDRAVIVDRYINKVLAAERGRELYQKEAKAAIQAAEREVLATLYTSRRMQELRDSVTEEQIKDYYTKNVLDDNFKLWKVSYYLSGDANDLQNTLNSMKHGDSKALTQLKPLVEQGDGFAAATAMPYNLGRVVAKMKKGEFSEVLQLRNGLLVLRVDDVKQLDKPKLDAVKEEIRQALALQKFNDELEQARKQAKVELG
jgi:peptidyl-prolyl cis-trans isomerase C